MDLFVREIETPFLKEILDNLAVHVLIRLGDLNYPIENHIDNAINDIIFLLEPWAPTYFRNDDYVQARKFVIDTLTKWADTCGEYKSGILDLVDYVLSSSR